MADILAALDELENDERAKNRTAAVNAKRKGSQLTLIPSSGRSGRPRSRTSIKSSQTLPPPVISTGRLTPIPKHRPSAPSPESRSRESSIGGESRRISFADPPRPSARRIYIPTKASSLASGFPYHPKLNKYGVLEAEWSDFSEEVVDAANVPGPTWAWVIHRKEVMRRIKKELQYEGDFKRVLRKWNKHFKKRGFQAWLELPAANGEPGRSQSADQDDSSDEDKEKTKRNAKKHAKRFRIIVSSNVEKGSSVYSRTSSLTRSITGEGINMQQKAAQKAHQKATEHAAQQDKSEDEKDHQDRKDDDDEKDVENGTVQKQGDNQKVLEDGTIQKEGDYQKVLEDGPVQKDTNKQKAPKNGSAQKDDNDNKVLEDEAIQKDGNEQTVLANGSARKDGDHKKDLENGTVQEADSKDCKDEK